MDNNKNINRVFESILNAHFKNCLYSKTFIQKLSELMNDEYNVSEVYNDSDAVHINIGGMCKIILSLCPGRYISKIEII